MVYFSHNSEELIMVFNSVHSPPVAPATVFELLYSQNMLCVVANNATLTIVLSLARKLPRLNFAIMCSYMIKKIVFCYCNGSLNFFWVEYAMSNRSKRGNAPPSG